MAYYGYNDIVIFPSSNAIDAGKRLTESNVKDIVTRITNRNYRLSDDSFVITNEGNNIVISSGSANIFGYSIVTTSDISIPIPENDGKYIIGIRLRFDAGTGNIFGDVNGSNVGVDINFFDITEYENDPNIMKLATGVIDNGNLEITPTEDDLYRIDKALYSKESGGISYNGNTFVIDQNLRTTDDVIFKSLKADQISYLDNAYGDYSDLDSSINDIRDIIKLLKGTDEWDDETEFTLSSLNENKLDASEVADAKEPNKILRLDSNSDLPCDITGNAKTADKSGQATYAEHIGTKDKYYDVDQSLRKTDSPTFNSIYLGQNSLENIKYSDNKLSMYSGLNGFAFNVSGTDLTRIDSLGNINTNGTITGTRVYNAVYNDYAEFYEKDNPDEEVNPGDIIEINPDTGKYRICTSIASNMVVGVCSNTYGHILGGDNLKNMEDNKKKYIPIGLSGRVYVNVEDGVNIIPGQLIISSYNGKAMTKVKAQEGTVIGKAIGYVEKIDGVRKVLMQIMLR